MKKKGIIVTVLVCVVLIISAALISCSKSSDKPDSDKSTDTSFSAGNASEDETATKGEADKATSDVADKVENITGTVTEGTDQSGDSSNEEPTGEPEAILTPLITKAEELTPTSEGTVVTVSPVATNTPTKAVVQKNTPTPTPVKVVVKNTPTPTPAKVVVKNTPTPTPTKGCQHSNTEAIEVYTVVPEEGHWETKAAWDEPVYVRGCVCSCGVKETSFSEDGKTRNDETYELFIAHCMIKPCSWGVTDILVDTIHHPAEQVWIVDKQEGTSYEYLGWRCVECGFEHYDDNCGPGISCGVPEHEEFWAQYN